MTLTRRILLSAAAGLGATLAIRPSFAGVSMSGRITPKLTLQHADGRTTDYRVMTPATGGRWGVVLFSHGANSSNDSYDRVWQAWADRGYMVIGPNHIDTGPPAAQRKVGFPALFRSRIADIKAPLAQKAPFDALAKAQGASLDWAAICGAGHSYGSVVAQALAGATILVPGEGTPANAREPSVVACVCLSPPGPLKDFIPADAWSTVTIPVLVQTGDQDMLPHFVDDWRSRLTGLAGAPNRWTIVARGVNHYFHGLICTLTDGPYPDLPALTETARLSGEFIDAYVRHDARALQALTLRAGQGDDGVLTFAAA
jgi:dienelactone hydrolase